jgi:BlaI family transcriptional regulator, penicillinase repressor
MKISNAESAVMEVIWRSHAPRSAEDIAKELKNTQDWSFGTIGTLLARLVTKRAISGKKDPTDGRRFLYRARIKREQYIASQTSHIAEQVFDGTLAPLVSHLSKRGKLTQKDIEELKRVIQEIERAG